MSDRFECPDCRETYDGHVARDGTMGCCPHCGNRVRDRVLEPGQEQLGGFGS